jgi:hypothetical protein
VGDQPNLNKVPENRQKMKKALITGITGQDGSYLDKRPLSKGFGQR